MPNIAWDGGELKALLASDLKAVGALNLSATAKYIGSVIAATGITSAAELVAITGLPRSTVYRAMTEFFANGGDCLTRPTGENPTRPTDGNDSEKSVPLVPLVGILEHETTRAPASITTRATKELPSEVSSYEEDSPLIGPPAPSKATSPRRGTRLGLDWQLPPDWRQWARLNFAHADDAMVTAEAEQFRDFWIAKTGAGATKLDWQATWRNWCRNSKTLARAPSPRPFNGGRMAYDEAKAARVSHFRALIASEATQ